MYGEPSLPPTGGGFVFPIIGAAAGGFGVVWGVRGAGLLLALCTLALVFMLYSFFRLHRGEKLAKHKKWTLYKLNNSFLFMRSEKLG